MAKHSKDIRIEADAARENVPQALQADPNARISLVFGGATLTAQELRNALSQAEAYAKDERWLSEGGALSTSRIHLASTGANKGTGAESGSRNKQAAKRGGDGVYLAALMDQLDALQAEIAELDMKIEEFENEHFSAEEMEHFDSLPEEERFAAKDKRMQELLEAGEITQAEYDRWKDWNEERAAKAAQEAEIKNALRNGTDAEIADVASTEDIEAVREARHGIAARQRIAVEAIVEARYQDGSDATRNDTSDEFGLGELSDDALFGEPSTPFSTVHEMDDTNPIRDRAPDMRAHYELAAVNPEGAQPDAQVDVQIDKVIIPEAGTGLA